MKIHADDCPALCQLQDRIVYPKGHPEMAEVRCPRHREHKCGCHAQQALDELVAAADDVGFLVLDDDKDARLQAALKPFLPNA